MTKTAMYLDGRSCTLQPGSSHNRRRVLAIKVEVLCFLQSIKPSGVPRSKVVIHKWCARKNFCPTTVSNTFQTFHFEPQALVERAAVEFQEQSEGCPRVWFQIINGTLWVDHSLAPWPDLGWYPAGIGGGVCLGHHLTSSKPDSAKFRNLDSWSVYPRSFASYCLLDPDPIYGLSATVAEAQICLAETTRGRWSQSMCAASEQLDTLSQHVARSAGAVTPMFIQGIVNATSMCRSLVRVA